MIRVLRSPWLAVALGTAVFVALGLVEVRAYEIATWADASVQGPADSGPLLAAPARARARPAAPGDIDAAVALIKAIGDKGTARAVKVGLCLVLLVGLLRRYAKLLPGKVGAFWRTTEGGSVLLFAVTFGGSYGAALAASVPPTWGLAGGTFTAALAVAGGWEVVLKPAWERIVRPLLARWLPSAFPPAKPPAPPPVA